MDEIHQLLTHYPPDCHPARVEPLEHAGGMSGANFWRIAAPRGTLLLRRWPTEHPTPDRLRFIHAVIEHASKTLDFLPAPIRTQVGQTFLHAAGHLWELAPWMPGSANYELAPSDEKLRAAMIALAQFHVATKTLLSVGRPADPPPRSPPPAIRRRLERLNQLTPDQIHKLTAAIDDAIWPELAPLARRFLAALPTAIPRAIAQLDPLANITLPLQPCLRDIWHDHVLFTGNRVTGLIDFGAVDVDTPATDIARLLGSLAHLDRAAWQTGLAAYTSTRTLSADESLAVFAINSANPILAGCNWIRWVYVDKRHFENRPQVIDRFRAIVKR